MLYLAQKGSLQMKKHLLQSAVICAIFLFLTGCGESGRDDQPRETASEAWQETASEDGIVLADSLDHAVVLQVDADAQKITFWNLTLGKSYQLAYDNATGIKSRYGEELVAGQLCEGDIVDVAFIKEEKKAKNIWLDAKATIAEQVTGFEINRAARTMEMNGERYSLCTYPAVISGTETLELMDINSMDTLRVVSIDHTVYSICITNGHGYVRLVNAEAFEGGWVEFGQSVIRKVEQDMLLVIPAGEYDMLISNRGNAGTKHVTVRPNEESQVDVSDLAVSQEKKEGGIVFTITPSDAVLSIDGTEVDYSSVVYLSYGIHQIELKTEGYQTVSKYIKVGEEMANISIDMNRSDTQNDSSVSSNSVVSAAASGDYKVYIDAPSGGELYVDGKYIGLIPTSFEKESGTYTVSVRKSGYRTRSYSLEVDDSQKDVHYSFSELEKSE